MTEHVLRGGISIAAVLTVCLIGCLVSTLVALIYCDVTSRRLPNKLTVFLFLQSLGLCLLAGSPISLVFGAGWALLYLGVGIWCGGIGGGDIKLAAGLGTLAGMAGFPAVLIAVVGANCLVLAEFAFRAAVAFVRLRNKGWGTGRHTGVPPRLEVALNATTSRADARADDVDRAYAKQESWSQADSPRVAFAHGPHMIIATAVGMFLGLDGGF